MLRFTDEAYEALQRKQRRERFQAGAIHAPERDILSAVLDLLHKHPAVAFAYRANTRCGYVLGHGVYDRLIATGAIKKGEAQFLRFNFKGAADITGMLRGGKRFECEVKADRGVVSDEQTAFIEAVNGGGGLAFVARSVNDVMRGLA